MREQQEHAALEAARVLAKTARVFFLEAMVQGFSEEQAFRLTQAWLTALCSPQPAATSTTRQVCTACGRWPCAGTKTGCPQWRIGGAGERIA